MTHYNTTAEQGELLFDFRQRANTQNERVLEFLKSHPYPYSPSQIQKAVLPNAPITSVRRSMTTLTKQGHLEKTTYKREGDYGRPEYCWIVSRLQMDEDHGSPD